ncbi:Ig-like domain-containing protein, partial [Vibrio owensii]|uniref:Ig-like domain-containing protein n=1 Tax=Vibrio owensii TaxID=696485 RepID=UPI0038CDED37
LTVTDATVVENSLQVTPPSASIPAGLTQAYQAQVTLTDGNVLDVTTDPALSWSSSDTAVATIDTNTGIATGVTPGTVTITASGTASGVSFTQTVELTVTDATVVENSLQVTPPSASIPAGLTQAYQAQVTLTDGNVLDVTTDPALSWSSSDTAVATIDTNTGIATGVTPGTVTITASGTASGVSFTQTVELTVTDATVVENSLQVTPPSASIPAGLTQAYQAQVTLTDGNVLDVTTDPALSWSSSDTAVATIDTNTGIATGVTPGTVTITASGTASGVSFTQTVELTVTDATVVENSLQVTPPSASIPAGLTQAYQAQVTLTDGNVLDVTTDPALSWSSSDTAVATIDTNTGIATGVTPGTVTITASGTASGVSFTQTVELTVTDATVVENSLQVTPPSASIPAGLTQAYQAQVTLTDGNVLDVTTDPALSWSSSDTAVATIDTNTGIATGVTPGTVTITASGTASGVSFTQTVELTVTDATVVENSLQVTPPSASIPAGLTQAYQAQVTLTDGNVLDVTTDPALSWSSSDTAVATIDTNTGIATGVTPGTVTITASGTASGVSFTQTVELTVTDATVVENSLQVTPPSASIPAGLTQAYQAQVTLTDGNVLDVTTDPALSWSSSDTAVATIDTNTGIATGVTPGTVTITASGTASGVSFTQTAELTVVDGVLINLREIRQPCSDNSSEYFSQIPIGFTILGEYSNGDVKDVTNLVTWTTSNSAIATIDASSGVMIGHNSGSVIITATEPTSTLTKELEIDIIGELNLCGVGINDTDMTNAAGSCIKAVQTSDGKIFTSSPSESAICRMGYVENPDKKEKAYDELFESDGSEGPVGTFVGFNQLSDIGEGIDGQFDNYCKDLSSLQFFSKNNWRRPSFEELTDLYRDDQGLFPSFWIKYGWPVQRYYWADPTGGGNNIKYLGDGGAHGSASFGNAGFVSCVSE